MHLQTRLIALLMLALPAAVLALPEDREQPINIEADHAQLDDQEGVTQYRGEAILTQGTLRIEGDIITFYYNENRQLIKAVAQGKPATYRQVHKAGDPPVRARALQMEYYADRDKIYLIGEGHVWQSGDEFTGNRIEYDIARNVVSATSEPVTVAGQTQQRGRVHMIIQPPPSSDKKSQRETPAADSTPQPAPTSPPATEATPASAERETAAEVEDKSYPTAVTTSRLNVRTGPGTQYNRIGTLAQAQEVIVLTRQQSWAQVRGLIDGEVVIGWVNSRYLQ